DITVISKQAEDILASSNSLVKDVNEKINTLDPVYQAAADVGQSVSDLNNATQNLAKKFQNRNKKSFMEKAAGAGFRMFKK
ncbi:DUF948 domain-containing protein, partial [Apilactobacillus sp. F1]|nr:DUF948 domain-containing protein [Apilactobacillus sp. F1]